VSRTFVVVGGGITGLSAAYELTLRARRGDRILLVEATGRLGGKIRTDTIGGALVEAGPDWFVTRQPAALELCEELGLGEDIVAPSIMGVRIWSRGKLRPLPPGFVRGVPGSPLAVLRSRHLSPVGAVRALGDLVLPGRLSGPDISIGALIRRRFGAEVLERLVDPMLAASRSGHAGDMSLAAGAPEIDEVARSNRSVMLALRRSARSPEGQEGHPKGAFVGVRGGMQRLVDTLVNRLAEAEIRTGARVEEVSSGPGGGYVVVLPGGPLEADGVVLAVPAPAASSLLRNLSPRAAEELEGIVYASVAVIGLVYDPGVVAVPPDVSGWLVPSSEGRLLTGCAWFSGKWPHSAPPDGGEVLRCFAGRAAGDPATGHDDAELVRRACAEIEDVIGLTARPRAWAVARWDDALPQYAVGHLDRMARVEHHLEHHRGLIIAGAGYRGSGLPDCIAGGRAAARRLLTG
jgi:protoporphyrinogen/coproporphyrinogen III oxidase